MKKKIIIAEKPSVASEYARVLGVSGSMGAGFIEGDEWIVTWTVGHLIQMSYPDKYNPAYKEWKLETLPFLPGEFKYEVIEEVKKQFKVVKTQYNRDDISAIYYAGDSGREGLYIQMLVRMMAGHNATADEKVVWIDSQTEDEILRGISEAKSVSEYNNLSDAGFMRAKEDYLVGINFSRLLTVLYGAMVNSGSAQKRQIPISVGRVMTCVLGMVVRREREIRNFRPTDFYRVGGKIQLDGTEIECEWRESQSSRYYQSPKLYSEFGFLKEADAKELIASLSSDIKITSIERSIEKKNAPLLYNLAELQGECTRILHISPAETLKLAQSLYEKKVTTYPRTDARVLSSAVAKEIDKNLNGLKKGEYAPYISAIEDRHYSIKGKYIDDSKITDHYAIIPTGKAADGLSGNEKAVYDMIVRRFLSVFYPPAEYEKVKFEAMTNGELFTGTAKYLLSNGFYEVSGVPDEAESGKEVVEAMMKLTQGNMYLASYSTKKGATQPPKRYTSGSLVLAMENAGNLIEDEELREQIKGNGIGTSATRADTIDKLIRLKYIELDKKQILTPSNFGEMIYEVVDCTVPDFLSPEITAEWEKKLSDVAEGVLSKQRFEADLYEYVRKVCDDVKAKGAEGVEEVKKRIRSFATSGIRTEIKEFDNWNTKIKCPLCGDDVETTEWGFKCKSNKSKTEGCQFVMGDLLGHRLLTKELAELLHKKKTGPFYDFISSNGKPFAAYVLWSDEEKKISFEFTDMPWDETEYKCPSCGKKILNQGNFYKCVDYIDRDNGCKFWVGKIAGKSLSKKDIGLLTTKGETELIKGFKSKAGNKFDAFLYWNKSEQGISFRFPNVDEIRTDYKCPLCGGRILAIPTGFKCENNKNRDEGCDFYAGTYLGHQIKEKELKEILSGQSTDLISFKTGEGKDKKQFEARLYWNREQKRICHMFDDNNPVPIDAKCPLCGEQMVKTKYGYKCSKNGINEGCQFFIGAIAGVMLEEIQVKKLLDYGKSDLIKGFKPKEKGKNPFSAYLSWDKYAKKIKFEFPQGEITKEKSDFSCPFCFKKMYKGNYGYYCDCGFKANSNIAGKEIEDEQFRKLFVRGESDLIYGFYSPSKRSLFSAKLVLDREKKAIAFKFEDKKDKEVKE